MKPSSRFVVAVHIMSGLALVYLRKKDGCVSSQNIAWSVNTNAVVIRRLLGLLKSANLVATEPGVNGGTRIARHPGEITLYHIYEAVEDGEVFQRHYRSPNPECPVGSNILQVLAEPLRKAELALKHELEGTTLEAIATELMQKVT